MHLRVFLKQKLEFFRLLVRLTPVFLLKTDENSDIFLTIYTLFFKTEIYINIDVEIDGDIISQTSEYCLCSWMNLVSWMLPCMNSNRTFLNHLLCPN